MQNPLKRVQSAKLKTTSGGVIQGFVGVALDDDKHQIIVSADAIGQNNERPSLQSLVEKARKSFAENPFQTAKLSADTGFCDEANLKYLSEGVID